MRQKMSAMAAGAGMAITFMSCGFDRARGARPKAVSSAYEVHRVVAPRLEPTVHRNLSRRAVDDGYIVGVPIVEQAVRRDPALETPDDPIWREFWLPIVNPNRASSVTVRLIDELAAPRPGMSIADIGAGGGFFSLRYAALVGAAGHIHAVDIDRRMTRKISYELGVRGVRNVRVIHVPRGALGLEARSTDLVMLLETGAFNTRYPLTNAGYFRQAAAALRPGGRLLIFNNAVVNGQPDREASMPGAPELIALASRQFTLVTHRALNESGGWSGFALLFERRP